MSKGFASDTGSSHRWLAGLLGRSVGSLPSAGVTRLRRYYEPVRPCASHRYSAPQQPVDEVLNWPSTHNMSRPKLRMTTLCSGLIAEQRLRQRAVIVPHHRKGFLRDRTHGPDVLVELKVQHGTDMQTSLRGVGIKSALCAVLLEHRGEPVRVLGEMEQRNGAVLDEGDRLAFLLHRHHHVEPRGAELGDGDLKR